jgi:hypothetical protein
MENTPNPNLSQEQLISLLKQQNEQMRLLQHIRLILIVLVTIVALIAGAVLFIFGTIVVDMLRAGGLE